MGFVLIRGPVMGSVFGVGDVFSQRHGQGSAIGNGVVMGLSWSQLWGLLWVYIIFVADAKKTESV